MEDSRNPQFVPVVEFVEPQLGDPLSESPLPLVLGNPLHLGLSWHAFFGLKALL